MEVMNSKNHLVWNPILREYVLNAPQNLNYSETPVGCPFCADVIEGKVSSETQVWLHPNEFMDPSSSSSETYDVVYSQDHHGTFSQLSVDEVYAVTLLWRDLYSDLATRFPAI